jgi:alpha-L-fucosidase
VDTINSQGGAITFDVPIAADGTIPEPIMAVLQQLGETSRPGTDK